MIARRCAARWWPAQSRDSAGGGGKYRPCPEGAIAPAVAGTEWPRSGGVSMARLLSPDLRLVEEAGTAVARLSAMVGPWQTPRRSLERRAGARYDLLQRPTATGKACVPDGAGARQGARKVIPGNVHLHALMTLEEAARQYCIAPCQGAARDTSPQGQGTNNPR